MAVVCRHQQPGIPATRASDAGAGGEGSQDEVSEVPKEVQGCVQRLCSAVINADAEAGRAQFKRFSSSIAHMVKGPPHPTREQSAGASDAVAGREVPEVRTEVQESLQGLCSAVTDADAEAGRDQFIVVADGFMAVQAGHDLSDARMDKSAASSPATVGLETNKGASAAPPQVDNVPATSLNPQNVLETNKGASAAAGQRGAKRPPATLPTTSNPLPDRC